MKISAAPTAEKHRAHAYLLRNSIISPRPSFMRAYHVRFPYSTVASTSQTAIEMPGRRGDFRDLAPGVTSSSELSSGSVFDAFFLGSGPPNEYLPRDFFRIHARAIRGGFTGRALPTSEETTPISVGASGGAGSGEIGGWVSPQTLTMLVFGPAEC